MRRKLQWIVVAGVALTLAGKTWAQGPSALEFSGELTADSAKDGVRTNSFCAYFSCAMAKGRTYQIDMKSKEVDSYLRLENPAGVQVAFDDDGGGFPNARIVYKAEESGAFKIVATTYAGGSTGKFIVTVKDVTPGAAAAPGANQVRFTDGKATFKGSEDLTGFGSLTLVLSADGKAAMIDAKSTVNGSWTQAGRTVTIRFGNCEYAGQLSGGDLDGTARSSDGSRSWPFRVHAVDAARAAQPAQNDSAKGTWVGTENLAGFGALTFVLGENGEMTMVDAKSTDRGTWTQTGRTVTIRFRNCVYSGEIDGMVLQGTAQYTEGAQQTWSFRVQKR